MEDSARALRGVDATRPFRTPGPEKQPASCTRCLRPSQASHVSLARWHDRSTHRVRIEGVRDLPAVLHGVPARLPARGAGHRPLERRRGVRGDPCLHGQRARRPVAHRPGHHHAHAAALPAGGGAAGVHASLQRRQDGRHAGIPARAAHLSQYGGGRLQERSGGAGRPHASRRALHPAGRIHRAHSAAARRPQARDAGRTLLPRHQREDDAAARSRPQAGGVRLRLFGGGAGGGPAARRAGCALSQAGRGIRGGAGDRRRGTRHPHRDHRARGRGGGVGGRTRPLPGGPQGPTHPPARDEGLRLGMAQAAVEDRRDRDR